MRFLKFTIKDYKALSGTLEIDISKKSLLPVIGINESGKTSILWAIFAFDNANDDLNDGRHLNNVSNLYKTSGRGEPSIAAEIEISKEEVEGILNEIEKDKLEELSSGKGAEQVLKMFKGMLEGKNLAKYKKSLASWAEKIVINRNLLTREYDIRNIEAWNDSALNKEIVENILGQTPYLLYFDDFRDIVHEEMEIVKEKGVAKGWLAIIEQLFKKTNKEYSAFKLQVMEDLTRRSVLADVCKVLNNTLAKEWEKFTLEEGARLDVELQYFLKGDRPFLKLLVKESVEGNDRYFGIQDRSKGFYWFFNFVMKLEFNPKVRNLEDKDTIYLLDEPGSYLHSSAQSKLCEKLSSLSRNNVVIYCTHSHYLLDPDKIPLNYIRIAQKKKDGSIRLLSLPEYKEERHERRTALQPIIDALKIKPFLTDLDYQNVCIVEGIYDYYVFEMFKNGTVPIKFLPSVNAQSIPFFISLALAWRLNYAAVWDNDSEGRKERSKAEKSFGEQGNERLLLLPCASTRRKNFILQDVFDGNDLRLIKEELSLPHNTSFEKTIMLLYYSDRKQEVLSKISDKTTSAVAHIYQKIQESLKIN